MAEDVILAVAEEDAEVEVEDAINQLKKTMRINHLTNRQFNVIIVKSMDTLCMNVRAQRRHVMIKHMWQKPPRQPRQ